MVFANIRLWNFSVGTFNINKVQPQANGDSAKVKVKVRINIHGVFSVISATATEEIQGGEEEKPQEAMDVDSEKKSDGQQGEPMVNGEVSGNTDEVRGKLHV